MNIVVEKQPKCTATLRVEIPSEKVSGKREQIVRGYASQARLPGFRPGKAPRAVVEKRFAREITEELNGALVNEAYDEALKQEQLKVLDFGIPENLTTNADGSVSFESKLTLAPDVTLPEYKGIKVTVPPTAVPDEEVDTQLQALRERFADFKDIEGRATQEGDFAVIDYTSTVDGQPTDEFIGKQAGYLSGREGFWVKVDEKAFLPGFPLQLVGLNVGDSKEIKVTLPEDFPVAAVQNKELVFQVTVKELKEAVLPELDDELAAKLAPGKTMEDIKGIIRENMEGERARKISDLKVNQIVAYFNEQVNFELPDELIAQETQSQANAMVSQGIQSGMTQEEIQSQQEEIFASAGNQAVSNLRTNFILQEIARAEGIQVNDQELVNHLVVIANQRKVAPKKFIKDLQRSGRIPNVRSSMVIGKAIDFLVEHATVEESTEAKLDA
ncbi:trigger factor [Luteolibacter sp. SL250]|uniref:trigger factor n=1 Tax=Luteolibacter sp. SL250 TaxID=2995170 RepID=UPI0022716BD6|nr:trigger factor [Luteolibacter sp. SL250]WAC18501.1 trigger factor [Luteolibacter sp. SL250]